MWQGNEGHEFQLNEIRTPPGRTPYISKGKAPGDEINASLGRSYRDPSEDAETASAHPQSNPCALTLVGDGANAQDVGDGVGGRPGARHGYRAGDGRHPGRRGHLSGSRCYGAGVRVDVVIGQRRLRGRLVLLV